jgi:hypothetical protein
MRATIKKSGKSDSQIKESKATQKHFLLRSQPPKSVGPGSTVSSWRSKESSGSSQRSGEKMLFHETIYIQKVEASIPDEIGNPATAPPSTTGTGGYSTPLPLEEIGEEFEEDDMYKSRAGRIGINGSVQESSQRMPIYDNHIDIQTIQTIGTQGSDGNEMDEIKNYHPSYQQQDDSGEEFDAELNPSILQTRGFDTSENEIVQGIETDYESDGRKNSSSHLGRKLQADRRSNGTQIDDLDKFGTTERALAVDYELSKYPAYYIEDEKQGDLTKCRIIEPSVNYYVPTPSLLLSYNTPNQGMKFVPAYQVQKPALAESRRAKHKSFEVDESPEKSRIPIPSKSEEQSRYRRLPNPSEQKQMRFLADFRVTSGTGSRNDKAGNLPRAVNIHYSKKKENVEYSRDQEQSRDQHRNQDYDMSKDHYDSDSHSFAIRTRQSFAASRYRSQRDQRSVEIGISSRKKEKELTEFLLGGQKAYVR